VALAEADLEEVDAGTDDEDEDVGVPELEALLG
jgi:hypothetical protein